ncbi:major capsid protein E [Serratia quinivorans]|uniref:major capsid protein E n=1 Tax=Serratia quinivorans TaxID=137545 RepID=UPI002179F032|nr:major capsid protein E [Serratia quinivorans]CAI0896006.1 Uncharacterised protein [Serratia quinivorans]
MPITVKDLKSQWEKVDLIEAFKNEDAGVYLLQDLDIVASSASGTPKARINDIVASEAKELDQVARYGTDTNHVVEPKPLPYDVEIPSVFQTATVSPADWQGIISPTTGKEKTVDECVVDKAFIMLEDYKYTREKSLSRAIFENRAIAKHTDGGDFNFTDVTGIARQTDDLIIGMSNMGTNDLVSQFSKFARKLRKQYGRARSQQLGFNVFCGTELYDALKTNTMFTTLAMSNGIAAGEKPTGIFKTAPVIRGYESFDWNEFRFILVDDSELYDGVASDAAVIVPRFGSRNVNPMRHVYGPSSRHQVLARQATAPRTVWQTVDDYGIITIHQEFSAIDFNLRPDFLMDLKLVKK